MNRRKFVKAVGGVSTAGLVGFAGCAQSGQGNGGQSNSSTSNTGGGSLSGEITLGVLAQTSGPFGFLGRPIHQGAQVGAATVSENTDLTVNIKQRDTELSPDTAVQKARELIERENADALFGISSSSAAKSVSNLAKSMGVPLIVTAAQTPALTTSECTATTFRTCDYLTPLQSTLAETTQQLSGKKKVAVIAPDYLFGPQTWETFIGEYKRRVSGVEVVNETFPAVGQGDYQSEIQQTMDANPDLVYTSLFAGSFISFAQQARQYDLFEKELVWGAFVTEVPKEMGTDMPKCIGCPLYYHKYPDIRANRQFVQAYSNRFNSLPAANAGEAYKGVQAIYHALNSQDAISTDGFVNGLSGLEFDSIMGTTTIRKEDHQAIDENIVSGRVGPVDGQEWYGFQEDSLQLTPGAKVTPKPVCSL
jgi:branched-chain amino acid transport system substrate-binding protein